MPERDAMAPVAAFVDEHRDALESIAGTKRNLSELASTLIRLDGESTGTESEGDTR